MLKLARLVAGPLLALAALPVVADEEMLLGRVQPEEILSISQEWRNNRDSYQPNDADIREIQTLTQSATLDVYLGTWCSDSRREVPHFLKILDRAAPTKFKVRLYGLDRTKKKPKHLAKRGAIERVPTFVLRVDGREIGRIVETPRTTLEHDLALLVERVPPQTR